MRKCKECGSYAVNLNLNGRDSSEPELCDVCYWRGKFESKVIEFPRDFPPESGIDSNLLRYVMRKIPDLNIDYKDIELILLAAEKYSKMEQESNE